MAADSASTAGVKWSVTTTTFVGIPDSDTELPQARPDTSRTTGIQQQGQIDLTGHDFPRGYRVAARSPREYLLCD